MSYVMNRLALSWSIALVLIVSGTNGAFAGGDSPTCADLINFDATFVGSNATCDQVMFSLTAELGTYNDCLAPVSNIVVEAEDGAVMGGPKIVVFTSPCSASMGSFSSNITVLPFFSSGLVKFTYRIGGGAAMDCGDVPGTLMVTLPDIAVIPTSPAVDNLMSNLNGTDVELSWTLPTYAGDGYRAISVQRRELFGANPPGAYACLDILAGNSTMYTDMNPAASPGSTGFEYRLLGILNPETNLAPPPVGISDCTDFDAAMVNDICGTLESTIEVLPPPTATLVIQECVEAFPNTMGVEVPVLLSSANHFGVTSVGISVAHDNAEITACAVTLGADAPGVIMGGGQMGFVTTSIGTDGVTAALITDITMMPLVTIPVGTDLEIFKLCYNTLGTPNITSPLTFATNLPIPNAPMGTFATTEVFALNDPMSSISQPIVAPELTLMDGSIKILSSDFIRGDFDGDQFLTLTDAILILNALFLGSPAIVCEDLVDVNDDGSHTVADAVVILNFLFAISPTPPNPPFPPSGMIIPMDCGQDPTPMDMFDCQTPPMYCP